MREEPNTTGERVAWAIERSGYKFEALAEQIGCTHATLSQWKSGKTDLGNAKMHLVHAFCEATGVNPTWLLTGDGPAISTYSKRAHPLILKAHELLKTRVELADTAERLLDALQADRTT